MGMFMGVERMVMREPVVNITKKMLRIIAEVDEFKGEWKAIGRLAPERLDALKKVATIESIGSSTRIEGVKLTDKEIEQLLAGLDIESFQSRDEEEVAGYAEVMNLVFESFIEVPLTENYAKQLHSILLKYSTKDKRHRGDYKTLPNHVEAFDQDGKNIGTIFETASPFDTPIKMKELLKWTNQSLKEKEHHPLIVLSIFIVHFLAIHPFQDGNGRLSRILTTLLLLQSGYLYVPYSSLENVIERNKENYYRALRKAQKTLDTDDSGLESWILFFLHSLKSQKDNLSQKVEREHIMINMPLLSIQILEIIKDHGRATISELQAITEANRNTIKVRLRELVADKYIVKNGTGKGTWYSVFEKV
jgi:Fic family protein